MVSRHEAEDLDEGLERLPGPEASEDLEDVDEALESDEDEEDSVGDAGASYNGDDDSDQTSLEEVLAQRSASKRLGEDSDDDSDILAFPPEVPASVTERSPVRVAPVRDKQEFVCKSCHLVKPRVQLADERRGLCRDCI